MKKAGDYMNNNKSILVPLKDKKVTLMSLQLIFKTDMKVNDVVKKDDDNQSVSNFSGLKSPRKIGKKSNASKFGGGKSQSVGFTYNDF